MATLATPKRKNRGAAAKKTLLQVEIDPDLKTEFVIHCRRKRTFLKQEVDRLIRRAIRTNADKQ